MKKNIRSIVDRWRPDPDYMAEFDALEQELVDNLVGIKPYEGPIPFPDDLADLIRDLTDGMDMDIDEDVEWPVSS